MGNSCNKVTPIVCTARITCTVPIGCAVADSKVQPAVIEPKPKEEVQPAPQIAFQEASPTPAPAPASPPSASAPATAPLATPNGEFKPAPILDPVEPFQSTEPLSPVSMVQRLESVCAVAAPATSSSGVAKPEATIEREQIEASNVEPIEEEEEERPKQQPKAQQCELVGVDEGADSKDAPAKDADASEAADKKKGDKKQDDADDADAVDSVDQKEDERNGAPHPDPEQEPPEDSRSADGEAPPYEAVGDGPGPRLSAGDAEVSEEDSSADLEQFAFETDGLVALERFQLRDKAEILGSRTFGHAAVQALQSMCLFALDAGVASHNCQLLLTQLRIIVHVLARAQQSGSHRTVRSLLEQLHPTLMAAQALIGGWSHRGSFDKFMSGRAADDEFLDMHLQLKDFAQDPAFVLLLGALPDAEAAELTELQSSQQLSGYCSVEASRASFERLLLLFILRYKPLKSGRTQKQRLMDLLASEYNNPRSATAAACRAAAGGGGEGGDADAADAADAPSAEELIDHLARARLGRAATHAVPLMVVLMTNMWGASAGEVPRGKTDKWRMAVRLALEPLREAVGAWQLPQVPQEDVQPWDDSSV